MPPAAAACPNPYFPLEEGLKLTYRAGSSELTISARASRPGAQGRSIESFIWFAPGVGIIKVSTGEATDLELLKVERPAASQKAPVGGKKSTKR